MRHAATASDMTGPLPASWTKIAAILLAALTGSLLVAWTIVGNPPIEDLHVEQMQLAPLNRPDIAEVATAVFVTQTRPLRHKGPYGVARITLDVTDPNARLALFSYRVSDNYAVYLNGHLAAPAPGVLSERSTLHGHHPRLVLLLPPLLKQGVNTLDIISARNGPRSTIGRTYLGPAARLQPAYRHARTMAIDTAELATIAAGMVLLFALALSPMVRPALTLTVVLTMAFFVLRHLHTLWVDYPWTQLFRDIYLNATAIPVWISIAAFTNEWTGGPAHLRRWLTIAAFANWAYIGAWYAIAPRDLAFAAVGTHEGVVGLCTMAYIVDRLIGHYTRAPSSAAPEIFVACIGHCIAAASITTQTLLPLISTSYLPQTDEFSQLAAMTFITFIAVGLARHGVGIYQLAALNNETLARQVRDKERELEANHALLREQERERTLADERSRIMRDMHDGIGSQLLGLLVQTRNVATLPPAISAGLQAAIDDLYLVVDSLDAVDGSLEIALGTFRTRIEPKCVASGIEIGWNVECAANAKPLSPASVLQIYRILQEALSNAIRHGKPKHIEFALRQEPSDNAVSLTLKDNGAGFDLNASQNGRGLANMRQRAASIGAHLNVTSGPAGTSVKLTLPQLR
jgi:signal transduction histidine kinase